MLRQEVTLSIKEADIISISIGGNNYRHPNIINLIVSGVPMGNEEVFDNILNPFYDDLCRIIACIKKCNPDTVIIVQTIYNPVTGVFSSLVDGAIQRLSNCFYRYNKEHPGAIVIADVATAKSISTPEYRIACLFNPAKISTG